MPMLASTLSPDATATLPYINDVLPITEADHTMMAEIKGVLAKHNALARFGVCLLHDHFSLADDEFMVESEDNQHRTLTTRPMKASQLSDSVTLIETQWRLDTPTIQATLKCTATGHGTHAIT